MKEEIWLKNPCKLNPFSPIPKLGNPVEKNVNSVVVLIVYCSLFGTIYFSEKKLNTMPLYIGLVAIGVVTGWYLYRHREQFLPLRNPTPNNPLMNVMPTDYGKPQKYIGHEPVERVKPQVEDNFKLGLYQDPNGKLWDRHNSQREYIPQPVAGVPNNQSEFAQWLYGHSEPICKEGSIYERYGVKTNPICNGINVSTPTNFGIKNAN